MKKKNKTFSVRLTGKQCAEISERKPSGRFAILAQPLLYSKRMQVRFMNEKEFKLIEKYINKKLDK